ncbi:hypothetical protein H0H92_006718 [Tricholoma furcatifolium]|nr:hypothetical protein H0H92_006718 [Tricholoma furcatifolium]
MSGGIMLAVAAQQTYICLDIQTTQHVVLFSGASARHSRPHSPSCSSPAPGIRIRIRASMFRAPQPSPEWNSYLLHFRPPAAARLPPHPDRSDSRRPLTRALAHRVLAVPHHPPIHPHHPLALAHPRLPSSGNTHLPRVQAPHDLVPGVPPAQTEVLPHYKRIEDENDKENLLNTTCTKNR